MKKHGHRWKHGHSNGGFSYRGGTPTYKTWAGIIARCNNKNNKTWNHYGKRGIKVCKRWLIFENFLKDMGVRPAGKSIERINNDGDYKPSNCKWATPKEQALNRRGTRWVSFGGKRLCIKDWGNLLGVGHSMLRYRLNHGWTIRDALTFPLMKNQHG